MRVWVDAQLAPSLARWMQASLLVDAVPLRDLGLRDAEDAVIFPLAGEAQAVILTKDQDFADLVTRRGPPPCVVWLTCGNTSTAAPQGVLHTAWPRVNELLAAGESLIEVSGRVPSA